MTLKLVSFSLCPFVQRAVIALREHGRPFDVEYISLANKPEWFLALSPRGKVPILVVEGRDVIFESHAICEYLDETTTGARLMPSDPLLRARDRAWFSFVSDEIFLPMYRVEVAKDEAALDEARGPLTKALARLEHELADRAFLSGDGARFGMADVAIAPTFFRMAHMAAHYGLDLLVDSPKVAAWSARVRERPSVAGSVPSSWKDDYAAAVKRGDGALAQRAAALTGR